MSVDEPKGSRGHIYYLQWPVEKLIETVRYGNKPIFTDDIYNYHNKKRYVRSKFHIPFLIRLYISLNVDAQCSALVKTGGLIAEPGVFFNIVCDKVLLFTRVYYFIRAICFPVVAVGT